LGKFSSKFLFYCLQPAMALSRGLKYFISLFADGLILLIAWVGAYYLRYDNLALLDDDSFVLSFLWCS